MQPTTPTDTRTAAERRGEKYIATYAGTPPDVAVAILRVWLNRVTDPALLNAFGAAFLRHANALDAQEAARNGKRN